MPRLFSAGQMECGICCETFNQATRKRVVCPSCQVESCQACVRRYLVESTVDAKCLSCRVLWNDEFLRSVLPRAFLDGEYREHQKDVLLSRAEVELGRLQEEARARPLREQRAKEVYEIRRQLWDLRRRLRELINAREEAPREAGERAVFTMGCPASGCRGQLSTAYRCGLCERSFCAQCHAEKQPGHECREEEAATVRLLRENTKPCPKCRQGIYKLSGCDQMWCTSCHTFFSWRTGRALEGGPVHNPHYFAFLEQNRGVAVDPRAHGCENVNAIVRNLRSFPPEVSEVVRLSNHLAGVTVPRLRRFLDGAGRRRDELGVQFLLNRVDTEQWRALLYRDHRKEEKSRRYLQTLEMLTASISDQVRQYISRGLPEAVLLENCQLLLRFTNEELDRMRKQYACSLPTLDFSMDTTRL